MAVRSGRFRKVKRRCAGTILALADKNILGSELASFPFLDAYPLRWIIYTKHRGDRGRARRDGAGRVPHCGAANRAANLAGRLGVVAIPARRMAVFRNKTPSL